MRLRELEAKDAILMLEWMHDPSVVENLNANFNEKTIDDCLNFIEKSKKDKNNCHLAIVDENDKYMGTVSLKNITRKDAEFAITIRKSAMSKGYSKYGMQEIIKYGLHVLGLKYVYWCVSPNNKRAVKFYDKNGYKRDNIKNYDFFESIKDSGGYCIDQIESFIWYVATNDTL